MVNHRFWQAPYLAWFSREFYQSVLRLWRGLGLGYLLFFLAIIWLINMSQINPVVSELKEQYVLPVVEQMPRLEFDGAKMSTDAETPYIIEVEGTPVAIIDPEASSAVLDQLPEGGVLLTQDAVIVKQVDGQVRETPWVAGIDYLDSTRLSAWVGGLERWVQALIYPFGLAGSFIFRLVEALILALVALTMANMQKIPLAYAQAVRLTVIAVTVAVMVQTLLSLLGVSVPFWWFVSFLIIAIYQYFGVSSYEVSEHTEEAY